VHREWAITAKHCLPGLSDTSSVTFNTTDIGENGVTRPVDMTSAAPGSQDIGLLHLAAPVDEIQPVRLAAPADYPMWQRGSVETIVGWGFLSIGKTPTTKLRFADHRVTDDASTIDGGKIVTAPTADYGGEWAYEGDSGAPLLYRDSGTNSWVQVGAFSAFAGGRQCAGPVCHNFPIINNRWGKVGKTEIVDWLQSQFSTTPAP
jgi:hypothetical protein